MGDLGTIDPLFHGLIQTTDYRSVVDLGNQVPYLYLSS